MGLSADREAYRDFITGSRGEFTVAKDQNVRLRSGWFSERSACYLAAGRPVVTQDTGFGSTLPVGEGLFAVDTEGNGLLFSERSSNPLMKVKLFAGKVRTPPIVTRSKIIAASGDGCVVAIDWD